MFFIGLLGMVGTCFGQYHSQLHFRRLSRENGLALSENTFVFQDYYGLTWFNSREGLNCFNGHTIQKFAKLSGQLLTGACLEDPDHNLWFSTLEAVYCYRRKTGAFQRYQLAQPGKTALKSAYYAFHLDEQGFLWVQLGGSVQGFLYLFNTRNGTFSPKFPLPGDLCYLLKDRAGKPKTIVSTKRPEGWGLLLTDVQSGRGAWKTFQVYSNGKRPRYPVYTNSVYVEGDSVIWAAVYDGIGVYFPKKGQAIIAIGRHPDLKIEGQGIGEIWSLAPYGKHHLLASTEEAGLLLFDKRSLQFVDQILADQNTPFGLKSNALKEMYLSPQQNLWVTEINQGLSFTNLQGQKFKTLPSANGKSFVSIFEDQGQRMWCSTQDSGLYVFNHQGQLLYHTNRYDNPGNPAESTMLPIHAFFEIGKNDLWGLYLQNLLRWDANKKLFHYEGAYTIRHPSEKVNPLQNRAGKMILSVGNELLELHIKQQQPEYQTFLDLSPWRVQLITNLFQDSRGQYYLADNYRRLLLVKEQNDAASLVRDFEHFGECHAFYEDQNRVWIAGSKGLFSLQPGGAPQAAPGLPAETFYTVIPDGKGYLWLSSNNGLLRYHPVQRRWDRFSQADGLQSQGFAPRAWHKASNGEIWLGGPNGLNVFHPDSIKNEAGFPPLMIDHIKVNDVNYQAGQNTLTLQRIPRLGQQENTLSFDFLAVEYQDPGAIRLKYRLRGQDEAWIETSNPGFVRFSKLPPGAYTLECLATNADGIWMPGSMAKKLAFFIPTPWWRTWWFYIFCMATTAAIAYGIFAYRLQQALKIERIRVRISSDLHDDVGTILSGLAMQSEILELSAPEPSKPKLRRISELSRSAMSRMRDTVWAIDARKDKLENLIDRMREHAEETLTPRDILLDLQVDDLALTKNMPSQIRQALYLIYKEAVTNCAKHSKGDKVQVRLQKIGAKGLEMSIHDNGVVMQKNYKTTGLGLSSMHLRAQQIGADFSIDTANGFLITVKIPRFS